MAVIEHRDCQHAIILHQLNRSRESGCSTLRALHIVAIVLYVVIARFGISRKH